MVQFSVDTSAVGYTAASMSAALAQFDAQVAAVTGAVNGVVGSSWSGEAADAFAEAWATWLQCAEMTRLGLSGIVADLQAAQGGYETTEAGVQSSTRALSGGAA